MPVLRDLIEASLDGEWGKGAPEDGLVPMLAIRGTDFDAVRGGSLTTVPLRYIKKKAAARKSLRPRDLLIEVAGGSKDRPTGRTLYVSHSLVADASVPLTCASFCRFVRVDPGVVNPEYLFWHLQALYEDRTLEKYHTQHTGVARFQWTTFADTEPLDLPPLGVQERVAAILMLYDELIENNLRRIEILEEMAQAIYREWFVNFRYPGHEADQLVDSPLGPIPNGWEVVAFGDLATEVKEGVNPDDVEPDTPYLGLEHIPRRSFTLTEFGSVDSVASRKWRFLPGDILFGRLRPYFHKVVEAPVAGVCSTDAIVMRPREERRDLALMVAFSAEFVAHAVGTAGGTDRPRAKWSDLEKFQVALPPHGLIARFSEVVRPMVDLAANLARQNANLRATRDLLLPKLVLGEIDVSGLDIDTSWLAA